MKDKLVVILLGIVALCLIGLGTMVFVMWGKISSLGGIKDSESKTSEKAETENKLGPIYSLETFIVNLDDPKYKKYLRLTMDLELDDVPSNDKIAERLPQIRDAILKILPAKKYEDVVTADGKNALRDEILITLNSFFSKKIVTNVYFTEFVIQ